MASLGALWLAAIVGVDYFADVTGVVLDDSSDATIEQVARLSRLERLVLNASSIDDAGLVHLKELSNLSSLDLGFTPVTDAGLTHLSSPQSLEAQPQRHEGHRHRTDPSQRAEQACISLTRRQGNY